VHIPIHIRTIAQGRRDLLFLLSRLVDIDMRLYRTRAFPPLYESGVRYIPEVTGVVTTQPVEDWQAIDVLYATKRGDCEDLACARVAELRVQGYDAHPRITKQGRVWHVTVRCGDQVEDPSKLLGMKGTA
jgi:hypothetical protein